MESVKVFNAEKTVPGKIYRLKILRNYCLMLILNVWRTIFDGSFIPHYENMFFLRFSLQIDFIKTKYWNIFVLKIYLFYFPESWKSFVCKVGRTLSLEESLCWDLICSYLSTEFRGTQDSLKLLVQDEQKVKYSIQC